MLQLALLAKPQVVTGGLIDPIMTETTMSQVYGTDVEAGIVVPAWARAGSNGSPVLPQSAADYISNPDDYGILAGEVELAEDANDAESVAQRQERERLGLGPLLHVGFRGGNPTRSDPRLCNLGDFIEDDGCIQMVRWRTIRRSAANRLGIASPAGNGGRRAQGESRAGNDPVSHVAFTLLLRTTSGIGWTSVGLGRGMFDSDIITC